METATRLDSQQAGNKQGEENQTNKLNSFMAWRSVISYQGLFPPPLNSLLRRKATTMKTFKITKNNADGKQEFTFNLSGVPETAKEFSSWLMKPENKDNADNLILWFLNTSLPVIARQRAKLENGAAQDMTFEEVWQLTRKVSAKTFIKIKEDEKKLVEAQLNTIMQLVEAGTLQLELVKEQVSGFKARIKEINSDIDRAKKSQQTETDRTADKPEENPAK